MGTCCATPACCGAGCRRSVAGPSAWLAPQDAAALLAAHNLSAYELHSECATAQEHWARSVADAVTATLEPPVAASTLLERRRMLLLLHALACGQELEPAPRQRRFLQLVAGPGPRPAPTPLWWRLDSARHARLRHLAQASRDVGWNAGDAPPPWLDAARVQTLDDFVRAVPAWGAASAWLLPRAGRRAPCLVHQRVHPPAASHLPATAVMLHYLVHSAVALDTTAFVLLARGATPAWEFIDDGVGGHAFATLQHFTRQPHTAFGRSERATAAELVAALHSYGPVLVTFALTAALFDPAVHSYTAAVPAAAAAAPWHSAVLIGWRNSAPPSSSPTRFLLQNAWPDKQFFECDVGFLHAHNAHCTWLTASPATVVVPPYAATPIARFVASRDGWGAPRSP